MKFIQAHIAAKPLKTEEYLFLALKRSDNLKIYPGLWQAVTGTIESGETAVATAIRESREEAGLELLQMWTVPYVAQFYMPTINELGFSPVFGFLAEYKEDVNLSSEHQAFKWLKFEEYLNILQLPTHKGGAIHFRDYILKNKENILFELNIKDYDIR